MLKLLGTLGIACIVGRAALQVMRDKSQTPITSGPEQPVEVPALLGPGERVFNRDELLWMLEINDERK